MELFDVAAETIEGVQVIKVLVSGGLEKPYYIRKLGMSPAGCYMISPERFHRMSCVPPSPL